MILSFSLSLVQLLPVLLFYFSYSVEGTVTQSPAFACTGDSVIVSCSLTVPNAGAGDLFDSRRTDFILGEFNNSISESDVDGSTVVNGIELSRFIADAPLGTFTTVTGSVTLLSYNSSTDNGFRMGCRNDYTPGGGSTAVVFFQTITLEQAVPPSILSPTPTIQSFNPSTCEGTLRFPISAMSDREYNYSVSFNGSSVASNLPSSDTEFTHNTQFTPNTNYPTSIIATSCAGSSSNGDASVQVNGYTQSGLSCAVYNNVTGVLTINWNLNTQSQPINIEYSVDVTYNHSNGIETFLLTNTSTFNLVSNVTTYDVALTAHNFTNPQGVETNVSAYVRILQQCGQNVVGPELHCSISSATPPPIPSSTASISPSSSIAPSASSTITPSTPIPTPTPNPTNITTIPPSAQGLDAALIGGIAGGIIAVIVFLAVLLILLGLCICCLKNKSRDPKGSDRVTMGDFNKNQGDHTLDTQPEDTYSQVKKSPKPEQPLYADINKPPKELLYADLDHVVVTPSDVVKPPSVPSTHYADLAQFSHSDATQYSTVQESRH